MKRIPKLVYIPKALLLNLLGVLRNNLGIRYIVSIFNQGTLASGTCYKCLIP